MKRFKLLISIISTSLLVWACQPNTKEALDIIEQNETTPNLRIKELETFISDSGTIKYKIITKELLQFDNKKEPYTEFPIGLQITSYTKDQKMNAEIKGNYAKFNKKSELWEVRNDVQAINYEGNIINTEELYWSMPKKRIYSDKFIKITTDKQIITGIGFESNEDFSKYTILKVNGIIELQE